MELVSLPLVHCLDKLITGKLRWPLYLYGKTGRGKSCAIVALLNRIPYSFFVRHEVLIDEFVSERGRLPQRFCEAPIVAVDEVGGRAIVNEWDYGAVKSLADKREGKAMIWISNLDPEALCRLYDDRIWSRLCCGTHFELTGTDQRFTQ